MLFEFNVLPYLCQLYVYLLRRVCVYVAVPRANLSSHIHVNLSRYVCEMWARFSIFCSVISNETTKV